MLELVSLLCLFYVILCPFMCLSLCVCSLLQYLTMSYGSIIVTQQLKQKASFWDIVAGIVNTCFHTKAHKSFWNNYIQFSPRDVIYRWNSPLELIVNGIFVACFPMLLSFCTWFRKRFMESHNYFKKAAGKVFFHHVYKSLLMLYRELCSLCLL